MIDISRKAHPKTEALRIEEDSVCEFLQKKKVKLHLPNNCDYLNSLSFCQNIDDLTIDLQGQACPSDFEHLQLSALHLKNCSGWPLSPKALEHLANQGLQKLVITSCSGDDTNYEFEVPTQLGKIDSLYKLELEHSNLKSIPSELLALNKMELLTFHTEQESLVLPDRIFSLPLLRYVYIDTIPSNTFVHIASKVQFEIRRPTFATFWQLSVWKKKAKKIGQQNSRIPSCFI